MKNSEMVASRECAQPQSAGDRGRLCRQLLSRRRADDTNMNYSIPIILLTLCAWASAHEPLSVGMQRRPSTYPVYANANELIEEYEPYAIAAIPFNSPMQIFQVIPPTTYPNKVRKPVKRPQTHRDVQDYASSNVESAYEPYTYEHVYSESITHPKYKVIPYEDEPSSVVVYARPNKNGGYNYRKPPTPLPQAQREPIIIRIHKYRVVH